ncbi:MAG TPA: MFS transporter [Alicycliphilus sp.]|nr:MFS transporter [Alicycliphilus sp.]
MTQPAVSAPRLFLAFACAYFLSALLRAVTATLAPVFSAELHLQAADLGLLAGAYFFGFAAMQLPLGKALDHFGPRRTLVALTAVAVLGCAGFALATSLGALIVARAFVGVGMSAALMAPLTAYRQHFSPALQLRANSWMLMTGSLGMVASTLPVQLLLPVLGWRGLFWALAAALALALALVWWQVPGDAKADASAQDVGGGYREIVGHPLFIRTAPMGFVVYGGLIAVQSLWAGPWLTRVSGWSPQEAAQGLFGINLCMLLAFGAWGALMPRLAAKGVSAMSLVAWGVPASLLVLAGIVAAGGRAGAAAWALWCVCCTFVALSQPAVAVVFPASQAGRALSAFNLVIFGGIFCIQWGLGLLVDLLRARGLADGAAFRGAFGTFALCCVASYLWFLFYGRRAVDNAR